MDIFNFSDRVETASGKCLEVIESALANMDGTDVSPSNVKSIMCLSNSLSAVSRSAADLERSTRERSHIIQQIAETMKQEIRALISSHPELIEQVQAVIDQATQNQLVKIDGEQATNESQSIGAKYTKPRRRTNKPKLLGK